MSKMEKGFYVRLAILVLAILVHVITDNGNNLKDGPQNISMGYYVAIAYLMYFCFYILTLKCKECNEPVVYKSINPSGWRLPKSTCSNCGEIFDDDIQKNS